MPFEDRELVQHLSLENTNSLRYLDTVTSKWITYLRSSPAIPVTNESVLHIKTRDADCSAVYENVKDMKIEPGTETVKKVASPEKRKAESVVIDLTGEDDRDEKRTKFGRIGSSSPLRRYSSLDMKEMNVGDVPLKLNKFPALTLKEMVVRLEWITDARNGTTTKQRFERVFRCKYGRTAFYNHRGVWAHMKETGGLDAFTGSRGLDADLLGKHRQSQRCIRVRRRWQRRAS